MRVRLEEGVYVDFVNLHADAGVEEGDEEARTSNIQQVSAEPLRIAIRIRGVC